MKGINNFSIKKIRSILYAIIFVFVEVYINKEDNQARISCIIAILFTELTIFFYNSYDDKNKRKNRKDNSSKSV